MSHKDAPPETPEQVACREFWQRVQPHVTRAWGRAADGNYLAESTRLLHQAWVEAGRGAAALLREEIRFQRAVVDACRADKAALLERAERAEAAHGQG